MTGIRQRAKVVSILSAIAVTAGALAGAPAHAVVGDSPQDGQYTFTAKLDIGNGQRSCTGTLVDQQWLITAAICFADNPGQGPKVVAGAPKLKTTATIGRADLTATGGSVVDVVELVPRDDRNLVMAKLATPVTGVAPIRIGSSAPRKGEELKAVGYGRTKDEWVPNRAHAGAFSVQASGETTVALEPTSAGAAICKGDTGGPALRESDGKVELAAVNSASWQGGCLGSGAEARKGAVSTRVDDVADWIRQITLRGLLSRADWTKADLLAAGYFTGGSANGTRHMDLVVRWTDGSLSLFQGADHNDPKYPFAAEHKVAAPNSVWRYARALTAGSFAATGTDGLVVRWSDGELTEYAHVDAAGFHDEKTHRPANTVAWQNAKLITAGRYTANPLRDDLLVVWNDGKVSLYADIDTNGVTKESVLSKANTTWPHAEQISAGAFTGKATNDLMVRWADGETTIYPGVDTAGFHGEIKIRDPKSPWFNAKVLTAGAFVGNKSAQDVLVRWTDGKLSLFPAVDAAGLHTEVKLVG
ncbi:S1 family peptidase [Streptomyces goshikiensis]|uniref:S1 family peptidase n=1 Tax=Streptomyces TaxID=1883 RepID=UPI000C26F646|nr:S1 family peptidase [Streptomyces sp. CB02120-2]PJN17389.1 esterase [Streptomyces sp. CB02120-2]